MDSETQCLNVKLINYRGANAKPRDGPANPSLEPTKRRASGRDGKAESPTEVRMLLTIELDQEEDGRCIAEVVEIPGALAYGATSEAKAQAIALRALAD